MLMSEKDFMYDGADFILHVDFHDWGVKKGVNPKGDHEEFALFKFRGDKDQYLLHRRFTHANVAEARNDKHLKNNGIYEKADLYEYFLGIKEGDEEVYELFNQAYKIHCPGHDLLTDLQ